MAPTKPILVGYDPRSNDRAPVRFGAAMARLSGAPLAVASVQSALPVVPISGQPAQYAVGQVDDDLMGDCSTAVEQIEAELRPLGIPVECHVLSHTSAARALHEAAEQMDAGLLVLGSSKRSTVGRVLAGASTAERLLEGAPCPVAVAPRSWASDGKPASIGVGYVQGQEGNEALRSAHALARHVGAQLRVITVLKPSLGMRLETEATSAARRGKDFDHVLGEHRVHAEKELSAVVAALDGVRAEAAALIGDPAEVLIEVSEELDLLVCGSRGYGPLRAVLLGSVSRRVMQGARCPVIVVPRAVGAPLEAILATPEASAHR